MPAWDICECVFVGPLWAGTAIPTVKSPPPPSTSRSRRPTVGDRVVLTTDFAAYSNAAGGEGWALSECLRRYGTPAKHTATRAEHVQPTSAFVAHYRMDGYPWHVVPWRLVMRWELE